MRAFLLTRTARYGIAVLSVVIATALRLALDPILGEAPTYLLLFFFPVILAAWYGGMGPGLLATALSLLLGDYLFIAPRYSILRYDVPQDLASLVLVGSYGTTVSLLADRLRKSIKAEMASTGRYRAFVEHSSEAIWRYEFEQPIPVALFEDEQIEMFYQFGYLAECNDSMAKMYGYDSADQIVGARVGDLLVRSDPRNIALLRAFRRAGYRLADAETREVDRQGNTKYFLNNLVGIEENGVMIGAWGTRRDITEQKRTEVALRESEERYRLLTEVSPCGVVVADLDGTIHLVNQSMLLMLAAAPEYVFGRNIFDFLAPEYLDRYREYIKDLMITDLPVGEIEIAFRREDGWNIPAEVHAVRFEWKGQPHTQIAIHDISMRKRAEAERERMLKEIEAERDRLTQILEQMPIGVSIADAPSGRLLFHNREAERLLRHPLLKSDTYHEYVQYGALHEDGRRYEPEEYPTARSLISGEEIKDEEARYQRGDGTETFFSVNSAPIRDQQGRTVSVVTTFVDIAERKRAEEARRRSEKQARRQLAQLEVIYATAPVGLCFVDTEYRFVSINDLLAEIDGAHVEGHLGRTVREVLPDMGDWIESILRRVIATGEPVLNSEQSAVLPSQPGVLRHFIVNYSPVKNGDGQVIGIQFALVEITERKKIEEELERLLQREKAAREQARRQLAQLEVIYATAPVGLCFVDTEYRFVNINDCLAEIHGAPVEGHLGRTVREVTPDMADRIESILRRVIATGEPVLNSEQSGVLPSQPGVLRHFIANCSPVKNGDGEVIGIQVAVVEITERKKIEEELERLLQQEKAAREEAEAAGRIKDDFLATISHELRTPLTSILGWARLLSGGTLSDIKARHAVEVIAKCAQSQTRLVDDILDTSRIITGRLKFDVQPVEIERVFQAAVDVIRPSAEVKGVVLSAMIDARGDVVFGDANRLQQAIWNLLSNAVKFTNEGGRIEARLARVGNQIEITVSDTGIGVEPQFLPHVFERFRQADSAYTRKYGGLGLGLAIVRHIVEMHGGGVSASSPGRNRGATFKIRLPLASTSRLPQLESLQAPSEAPQAKGRKPPEERLRLGGVRILLVEDDREILDMLKFIFGECGAEVITAASASEALDALERFRPDALISDLAMPDQDGYDLIREVRSREPERGGKIPAVAVTAYTTAEDRIRALASGFQMYVAKPVDPDELITIVASLTGHIPF